ATPIVQTDESRASDAKASFVPSGDHAGSRSFFVPGTRCLRPPAAGTVASCSTSRSFSYTSTRPSPSQAWLSVLRTSSFGGAAFADADATHRSLPSPRSKVRPSGDHDAWRETAGLTTRVVNELVEISVSGPDTAPSAPDAKTNRVPSG